MISLYIIVFYFIIGLISYIIIYCNNVSGYKDLFMIIFAWPGFIIKDVSNIIKKNKK